MLSSFAHRIKPCPEGPLRVPLGTIHVKVRPWTSEAGGLYIMILDADPMQGPDHARDIVVRPVDVEEATTLAPLTFRSMAGLLTGLDQIRYVAFAAWAGNQPVGLLLAGPNLVREPPPQLYSLVVASGWRRRGIGSRLLDAFMDWGTRQGHAALVTEWSDRLPGNFAVGAALLRAGWTPPRQASLRLQSTVDRTERVFTRRDQLLARLERDNICIISWGHAPAPVKERLVTLATMMGDGGTLPHWGDPRPWLAQLDPLYSLLILDGQDNPLGWIICEHQVAVGRWFFPIGWIHPDHARRGLLMAAIARVTAMLAENQGPDAIAAFETTHLNKTMWYMLEKHFRPHATMADYLLASRCDLIAKPGGAAA